MIDVPPYNNTEGSAILCGGETTIDMARTSPVHPMYEPVDVAFVDGGGLLRNVNIMHRGIQQTVLLCTHCGCLVLENMTDLHTHFVRQLSLNMRRLLFTPRHKRKED